MSDDRRDPDDRRGDVDPDELDDRVAELEERVRTLRDELGRPPEGPLGLPRPPTPREVLSFTGEYAIPTAIATLEANIRALKALQRVITILDPDRSVVGEERDRLESRAADASRATLDRLESALEDVEATVRESDLPREDEARSILDDARRINREIRDRVDRESRSADEARERRREDDRRSDDAELDGGTTIELDDAGDREASEDETESRDDPEDGSVEVDVDAELQSIKDELGRHAEPEDRPSAESADETPDAESDDADSTDADSDELGDGSADEGSESDGDEE